MTGRFVNVAGDRNWSEKSKELREKGRELYAQA